MKSDEERQERGDVLETRQFGFVLMIALVIVNEVFHFT